MQTSWRANQAQSSGPFGAVDPFTTTCWPPLITQASMASAPSTSFAPSSPSWASSHTVRLRFFCPSPSNLGLNLAPPDDLKQSSHTLLAVVSSCLMYCYQNFPRDSHNLSFSAPHLLAAREDEKGTRADTAGNLCFESKSLGEVHTRAAFAHPQGMNRSRGR